MKKTRHLRNVFAGAALSALALLIVAPHSGPLAHEGHDDEYVVVDENTDTSNPNIKYFKYDYFGGKDFYPAYEDVWRAMEPTFKGTHGDQDAKFPANPVIGITEFDLNNDDVPEIIAFPIESMEYGDVFCGADMLCPHYIIDASGAKMKVIGVLRAFSVDRGDEIKNGYWTLKAFTKQDDPQNFSYHDLYAFSPASGNYTKLEP